MVHFRIKSSSSKSQTSSGLEQTDEQPALLLGGSGSDSAGLDGTWDASEVLIMSLSDFEDA